MILFVSRHKLSSVNRACGQFAQNCLGVYLFDVPCERFKKLAIQARAQMAADKEAVGLSRVHMYESKCILPLRENCLFCS